MESMWKTELPRFQNLCGDKKTQVLIIGGGMAGILCAYMLHRAGVPYILLEQNRICSGVTGRTTAKITSQHGAVYHKLLKQFGQEGVAQYYRANQEAVETYRSLCARFDCDFEEKDSFLYATDDRKLLEQEMAALETIGADARFVQQTDLTFSVAGAIRLPDQAQFHPLKFVKAIVKDLNIRENSPVKSFDGRCYFTDRGTITAEKTIVATHFPMFNKHGLFPVKLYQHRSYVLGLKNAGNVNGMYMDVEKTGLSFRNAGETLLIGGGAHRTGKKGSGWEAGERFAREYYPQAQTQYRWATQDCMSLDGVPYVGQYSPGTPELFVATGFNKWGMTSSLVAAEILCDLVQGKENSYALLFDPSRSMLRPQLAVNGLEAAVNLLTPTAPRCPHLGCALKWNRQEHSWDCPCHGSRFDREGKVLNNPATGDLKSPPPKP